jgi:hypothetical protein
MLVRLLPEQAARHWKELEDILLRSLPPDVYLNEESTTNILQAINLGTLVIWVSVTPNDKEKTTTIHAVVSTMIANDSITGTRNLLIYTLTAVGHIPDDEYVEGYKNIVAYAKSRGCHKVIAFSNNDRVLDVAKKFNVDASWRMLQINL